jgi:hypothetical protein
MRNYRASFLFLIATILIGILSLATSVSAFISASRFAHHPTTASTKTTATSSSLKEGLFQGWFGPSGPTVVVDIPAKIKVGALRFLLQIYLVGQQNQPQPKSWVTQQGASDELQVYYADGTAMLSIDLQETGVTFTRIGDKPSLQYKLQESVLIHGVLDELQSAATQVDIPQENRLLQLDDELAIQAARKKLPARAAT